MDEAKRIIEILANEIAQKSVQIAQLATALEGAQKRIAELEAAQTKTQEKCESDG